MDQEPGQPGGGPGGEHGAWTVLSYLLSGLLIYGLIGWGLDKWLGTQWVFTLVGVLVGVGASVYLVYVRYLKS
jgi:F0F1-type ATP synthase assembly protein I